MMTVNFRFISSVTAVIAAILCITLMCFPQLLFFLFQIEGTDSASFIARRASLLFLGISVLSWQIRNTQNLDSQQAVCLGFMSLMFGLAILGGVEFLLENAGVGIFLAIVTELTLGALYFKIWYSNRLSLSQTS